MTNLLKIIVIRIKIYLLLKIGFVVLILSYKQFKTLFKLIIDTLLRRHCNPFHRNCHRIRFLHRSGREMIYIFRSCNGKNPADRSG